MRRDDIAVDWRVRVVALLATVVTGLVVGALPAVVGARMQLSQVMKSGGRASTSGPSSRRTRGALIAVEVALSAVLLPGAGLVAHSFWALQHVSLGLEPDHLALAELTVSLPNDRARGKYVDAGARAQFFDPDPPAARDDPGCGEDRSSMNPTPLLGCRVKGARPSEVIAR